MSISFYLIISRMRGRWERYKARDKEPVGRNSSLRMEDGRNGMDTSADRVRYKVGFTELKCILTIEIQSGSISLEKFGSRWRPFRHRFLFLDEKRDFPSI